MQSSKEGIHEDQMRKEIMKKKTVNKCKDEPKQQFYRLINRNQKSREGIVK